MWCHLCKLNFTDHELFKCHIMEKHRLESDFYKDTDSDESEQENEVLEHVDSDLELYNEESRASSEGAEQDFSDTCLEESSSKSNTRLDQEFPSNSAPHSNSGNTYALRRSNRIRKGTSKFKTYSFPKHSDANEKDESADISASVVNQVCVINPADGQTLGQQPLYVINPSYRNSSELNGAFSLNSKNIREWLTKHKELCRNLRYPLPQSLYRKIKIVHKEICSRYCMASPSEENRSVLKVYEDLNNMILKHIACVNTEL